MGTDENTQLWKIDKDSAFMQFVLGEPVVRYASWSADDTILALAPLNKPVEIWDTVSGEKLYTLVGHKGFVDGIALSPDGTQLLTGGSIDSTIRLWDVSPWFGGEYTAYPGTDFIIDVELSPDDQWLAMGNELGAAGIFNPDNGELHATLPGEPGTGVYRVSFRPDGQRIATVGEDNTIRIWNVETGELIQSWIGHEPGGNSGGLYTGTIDVSYSPDGTRLATAGTDGVAKIWDAETGSEIFSLEGHTDGLHS